MILLCGEKLLSPHKADKMASRNKERPNLKICIDNSEDAGNSEESEEENNEEESSSENSGSENEIDLDVSEQEEEEMEAAITLGDNRGDESPYRVHVTVNNHISSALQ